MTRHNKKRNAGLLYEFLVRAISRALIERRDSDALQLKSLIKTYFKKGTELHREYRLINALVNVPISSEAVAYSILSEAKSACIKFDSEKLKSEKDKLIKEINYSFGKDFVYGESVPNYKSYATAFNLIKYWRDEKDLDINEVVKFEKLIVERLTSLPTEVQEEEADPQVDNLVVKIASEKINERYKYKLAPLQTKLLRSYTLQESAEELEQIRVEICDTAIHKLEEFKSKAYDEEKASIALENIRHLKMRDLDDSSIERLLEVEKLAREIERSS